MKKLNKKFVAGTAFALGAATALTGCRCILPLPNVHNPAPASEIETSEKVTIEYETGTEIQTALYGPPGMPETATEVEPPVYGPPEWFEPGAEIEPTVYGPPDIFDPEEEVDENVYGPPDAFSPEDEVMEDVYGPPEWFD